jgi:hypothetical protein
MRTTYKGQSRAQSLKHLRDAMAYQKRLADGKEKSLREKYFAEPTQSTQSTQPTRWERVKDFLRGLLMLLALFVVSSVAFLGALAWFSLPLL